MQENHADTNITFFNGGALSFTQGLCRPSRMNRNESLFIICIEYECYEPTKCSKRCYCDYFTLLFSATAITTSSKLTRPLRAHEPKQRKARIEDGERLLRVNGRRWRPCENTRSTEVDVAEVVISRRRHVNTLHLPGMLK
jgi:hypothetical protein